MNPLQQLAQQLSGELHTDHLHSVIYATDASVYRELPLAVAIPKDVEDLQLLIQYANANNSSLIPRAGGTSLAGQCVGDGIVVDISKHFNQVLEFNAAERWVRVQPGVVRDELNAFLRPHGLFFSPITSTANRAMIGGMVGNNSSGTTSIVYGTTRDHILEIEVLLSDGSPAVFGDLDALAFAEKCKVPGLEGQLYRQIEEELNKPEQQAAIRQAFPKPDIHRRNTGYAVDALLESSVFSDEEAAFNFGKLLCGSEGTLAFTTAVKLNLDPLPDPVPVVLAVHFRSVHDSLLATQLAMQHQPSACELMDKIILDCTRDNLAYRNSRFFVEGDPKAVLMVEFRAEDKNSAKQQALALANELKDKQLGYAYPIIPPERCKEAWSLRSAGLGLLANLPGDAKAVACIEDTAVSLANLPNYIAEFEQLLASFGQEAVYYAHAGAGELHLRPILNLKQAEDQQHFYNITLATAKLVKKYGGSLSGEHGDGRLRATFIPLMIGEDNYQLLRRIKQKWDPNNIFNPGKIVDAAPMKSALRYQPNQPIRQLDTVFDFSATDGILRAAEKCNGSGDCRKLPLSGGTMCPSYQATRNEKDTTRARANALREFLTQSEQANPFAHEELKTVMDLCISCKGCTSECPSNVDMASLKAEFLHQYYQTKGIPLRASVFGAIAQINHWGSYWPAAFNGLLRSPFFSKITKSLIGVARERSLPQLHTFTLRYWYQKYFKPTQKSYRQQVYLFCDAFTNYNDTVIGIKAISLLDHLGYEVQMIAHPESGRAAISKGLLKPAQRLATENVALFKDIIHDDCPLIGIEPSAILSFRDEYPRLVPTAEQEQAKRLAKNCLLIDEFLAKAIKARDITSDQFTDQPQQLLLHAHCHQKALSSAEDTVWMLSLPANYHVSLIPSGCCGMAGSFGYEAEHYELSQQIGELVLFPAVRTAKADTIIVAPGTSCRHQIVDGTSRAAKHPVEVLWEAISHE